MRIAVVGASGFVGSSVTDALTALGHQTVAIRAPRLTTSETSPSAIADLAETLALEHQQLSHQMTSCHTVVNAAGDPGSSRRNHEALIGANALLPAVLAVAAHRSGAQRMVHVSSAVVQGNIEELDDGPCLPAFSPYSHSKILGETVLDHIMAPSIEQVIYRPPSVHGEGRRVTRMIASIGGSPLAFVGGDGNNSSPQALVGNVGSAIAFLATSPVTPPRVVIHPSEGLSTTDVMVLLSGGHIPRLMPLLVARLLVKAMRLASHALPRLCPNTRRLELILLGQRQSTSWLTKAGWAPPEGRSSWVRLGRSLQVPR